MKTDEIKALVAEIRSANKAYKCVPNYLADSACDAIESLLARDNIRTFAEQEARIAELEKELAKVNAVLNITSIESEEFREQLARVKAESLRVVELPDDYNFMPDYYMTPDGIGWNSNDRHGDGCVETPQGYHKFADCKKVRIERWEDEA